MTRSDECVSMLSKFSSRNLSPRQVSKSSSRDRISRTVRCAACDQVFDPFDFLQKEVNRLQRAWEDHKHVQKSLNDLRDGVESLKKEEARLKARIRTAKAKVAPVIDLRNREL